MDIYKAKNCLQTFYPICPLFCAVFSLHDLDNEVKARWIWR